MFEVMKREYKKVCCMCTNLVRSMQCDCKCHRRGFARLSPERLSEIARLGGKKAHENGTAHEFNSETGKKAGVKGGKKRHEKSLEEK